MADDVAALFDWAPTIRCQRGGHESGLQGCAPGELGTHVVILTHGVSDDRCDPIGVIVCLAHCEWVRDHADEPTRCPTCRRRSPLSEFVTLDGPISGSDWTGTAKKTTL